MNRHIIYKTMFEIQSGQDRVKWAEGLIQQLPETHDGRNSWLLNYGKGAESETLREARNIEFDPTTEAAVSRTRRVEHGRGYQGHD